MSPQILHFTHVDNLPPIFELGSPRCDTDVRESGCLAVEVGSRSIKERRRQRPVPCGPRGVVADYVPFYFSPRSPMLYSIRKGNVPEYPDGQQPLVYLVSTVEQVRDDGRRVVFSDGNAGSDLTEFFTDLESFPHRIDWPLMAGGDVEHHDARWGPHASSHGRGARPRATTGPQHPGHRVHQRTARNSCRSNVG